MAIVNIEVFGGLNQSQGTCGAECGGCAPGSAGRREYEIMREFIQERFGPAQVGLEFIDTMGVQMGVYPLIGQAIRAGHLFPITVLNGVVRWSGAMPLGAIIEAVNRELVEQSR